MKFEIVFLSLFGGMLFCLIGLPALIVTVKQTDVELLWIVGIIFIPFVFQLRKIAYAHHSK